MTSGARGTLIALGGYGLTMVLAGLTLVAGPGPSPVAVTELAPDSDAVAAEIEPIPEPMPEPTGVRPTPAADLSTPLPAPSGVPSGVPTAREASAAPGQRVAFVPSELRLPNGTRASVIPVGVAPDGALVIPENPAEVGVWDGGARVGDEVGSLVIAGHVDSRRYGLGVLAQLKGVRKGAVIELGNGAQRQRYAVQSTQYVNQQSLAADDQFFRQDVAARLVVITCGGPFDPVRRRYRDNYIVVATPA